MSDQLTIYRDEATGLDFAADIGETTPVSWKPRRELTFEEWESIGNTLLQISTSLNWWIGDWLAYGEHRWGEMYAQARLVTGWEYQRLADAKYVSVNVKFSLRNENLTWSHHREVASLEPEEQAAWLNRAATEGWSVRQLREAIRETKTTPIPALISAPPVPPATIHDNDDDVPFNHQTRWGVPEEDRTPVDEYEQQDDPEPITPYLPPETDETLYTNGHNATSTSKLAVHFSSETPEHYTPQEIVAAVIEVMDEIDLDPCSNSHESPNVPAKVHYTKEDDGLVQFWQGRVYMNPPYGREIGAWVDKLCEAYNAGDVTEAIALVPARTDTQWWKRLNTFHPFVCFVEGRLVFGGNEEAAPFPSAVVYLGDNLGRFYYVFSRFGEVYQKLNAEMFGA